MSNSAEKPMHLRARTDRGGAKIIGPLTALTGLAYISQGGVGNILGGLFLVYAGLIAFPATRVFVSRGLLGFTKWRAYAARLLWFFVGLIGLVAAYPT
jgi:hypothetical protein